jgi:dienelactone hydrolase
MNQLTNRRINRQTFMDSINILLALLIVALLLPSRAVWGQTASCAQTVLVQPGETLSVIAGRTLGNQQAYSRIIAATNVANGIDGSYARIDNANVIVAGWKLCIPAEGNTVAQPVSPLPAGVPAVAGSADAVTGVGNGGGDEGWTIEGLWAARQTDGGPHPLTVDYLRGQSYPGSPIVIEQTLAAGSNYNRYLVSYRSEGLKIYAYMTVPFGEKPATGWPVVVFNHGYIPPEIYRPTERYIAYTDAFARAGYILIRPDYRGHADSEGEATGAYGDPGYTIDVLNAISSIAQYPDADPNRLGLWGHSMGGYITARAMVVRDDIKAGVIWAGVVASYPDIITSWTRRNNVPTTIPTQARRWRQVLQEEYGTPEENPQFWASISTNSYVDDLSGPVQLHHGTADADVPVLFSELLYNEIQAVGLPVEYYTYPGDDHNIAANFGTAMQRSVAFMDQHVKNAPAPMPVASGSTAALP